MSTKLTLIDSAIVVLTDNPSANIDAIASKAEVSRRTLHRYFSSRDSLIEACAQYISDHVLSDVQVALDQDLAPKVQLRKMFNDDLSKGVHFEFCQKHSEYFKNEKMQNQFKQMGNLFNKVLDALKSSGEINPHLSNDWLAYAWIGIIRSANQALNDGVVAPKKIADLAWNTFTNGIFIEEK